LIQPARVYWVSGEVHVKGQIIKIVNA